MRHFTVWRWDFRTMTIRPTKHIITNDEQDIQKTVQRMNHFVANHSYDQYAYLYTERDNATTFNVASA